MQVSRRVLVGVLPALVIAGGVLAGNALLYHDTTLAPYARLHNLEYIGERFARQGPTLTPDFEEYAEYYLRDYDQDSMVNGPTLGLRPGVNREAEPGGIFAYDLNEFSLSWVEWLSHDRDAAQSPGQPTAQQLPSRVPVQLLRGLAARAAAGDRAMRTCRSRTRRALPNAAVCRERAGDGKQSGPVRPDRLHAVAHATPSSA